MANDTDVIALLQTDLHLTQQLLETLRTERELLIQRDQPALTRLLSEKTALLVEIENNALTRFQYLEKHQQPGHEQNWRKFVEAIADDRVQSVWSELQEAITACKHHNEVNGKMIARSRISLGRLLGVLRGQPEPAELYNRRGEHQGNAGSGTTIEV